MKTASISLLRLLIAVSTFGATVLATAQGAIGPGVVLSGNDGSVTIDASRLTSVIELGAPWRFAPNDDPRYADPAFDDSKWVLIPPGTDKLLADSHTPNVVDGSDWSRIHLHLLNVTAPIGLFISTHSGLPYEVFANGRRIMVAKGFASDAYYENRSAVVQVLPAKEVVLAIHCFSGNRNIRRYDPIEEVEIGQYETLRKSNELDYYNDFFGEFLIDVVISCAFFACIPLGITLFLAQRNHREYLWLSILCATIVFDYMSRVAIFDGWIPATADLIICRNFFSVAVEIACLEFVAELAGTRRRGWIRVLQVSIFIFFILFNFSSKLWIIHLTHAKTSALPIYAFFNSVAVVPTVGVMLWSAFRQGKKECGLFLIPIILLPLSRLLVWVRVAFPHSIGDGWYGHFAGVGFTEYQLGSLPLLAGLVGIVSYRFIRVSRDEEIAAAELEAARTVQQLLIPAQQPETPGFHVESVYLPARQVGGDFFMLLPSATGSNETALLAVMGDVSGKGLQAAMVVSTIIGALRVLTSRQPGELLAQLNSSLAGHISGFATCCAVLIQLDGRMTMANAGNPAPYSGGEEIPTLPGLPLGMVEGIVYEESEYTLDTGRQLTFVSDGVIEATSVAGKTLFGFERTEEISSQSAAAIAEAVCRFGAGAQQADDITVLTIRLS